MMRRILVICMMLSLSLFSTVTAQRVSVCDGFESRLEIGSFAEVTPGGSVNIREAASMSSDSIGQIPEGSVVEILEGPTCRDELTWWRVDYEGVVGWTGEGNTAGYLLAPVEEFTLEGINMGELELNNLLFGLAAVGGGGDFGLRCTIEMMERAAEQGITDDFLTNPVIFARLDPSGPFYSIYQVCLPDELMPDDFDYYAVSPSGERFELYTRALSESGIDGFNEENPPPFEATVYGLVIDEEQEGIWTVYIADLTLEFEIQYESEKPTSRFLRDREGNVSKMIYYGLNPNEQLSVNLNTGRNFEKYQANENGKLILDIEDHFNFSHIFSTENGYVTWGSGINLKSGEEYGNFRLILGTDTSTRIMYDATWNEMSLPNLNNFKCPDGMLPLTTNPGEGFRVIVGTGTQPVYAERDKFSEIINSYFEGAELLDGIVIECGENGTTWRTVIWDITSNINRAGDSYSSGWIVESDSNGYNLEVIDISLPEPTSTPAPTTAPPVSCTNGFLSSRLIIGQQGYVIPGLGPNALLTQPAFQSYQFVANIAENDTVMVLEGPVCDTGSAKAWWRVDYNGQEGWTAEGENGTYWLAPVENSNAGSVSVPTPVPQSVPPQSCTNGFLPSRLIVGQQGYVIPGMGVNSFRNVPRYQNGSVSIGDIAENGVFTVLAGPDCDTSMAMAWWQVEYNGEIGWTAEGQDGTYWLAPVENGNSGSASVPAPAPQSAPPQSCSNGFLSSRLIIGQQGYVIPGMGANAMLNRPRFEGAYEYFANIAENGIFTVLEGPICDTVDAMAWWRVDYNGQVGWTAEGQDGTYWLAPVE